MSGGTLPPVELLLTADRVTLPVRVAAPVRQGSVTVCLSLARGGVTAHGTLERTVVVSSGEIPDLELFARDIRAVWPRGGRAWLVVRYAGQLWATGEVRLVTG